MSSSRSTVENYYAHYATTGEYDRRYPGPNPTTLDFITQALAPKSRLLDAGCGNGRYLVALRALGYDAHGVDLSPEMVAQAQKRLKAAGEGPQHASVASITRLPFLDASHDAVVCLFGVLSHLQAPDRQAALREFHRVLAPGGHLVLSVPSRRIFLTNQLRAWWKRRGKRDGDGLDASDVHYVSRLGGKRVRNYYHLFTPRRLRKLVEAAGFEVLQLRPESLVTESVAARLPFLHRAERRLLRRITPLWAGANLLLHGRRK